MLEKVTTGVMKMFSIIFNPYNLMFGWWIFLEGQRNSIIKQSKVKLRGKTGTQLVFDREGLDN